ncbi:hypothetical protein AUK40_04015 [Candidatus Wirthbacteria bacterium CG2_30_54_11]|uniref:EamA domain-containing protein n=1 Tax=Candidatus Wirthbacteria bacterium CG2_30_54_11 TaxID=1817892 RepID=A0A1J5J0T8_9BACT|nr:MAG: hypothetical protein AUK40_04015 [Candidatus Wirthbacteria bacterium CG2_30_54_11]
MKALTTRQKGFLALILVAALQSCMGLWARYLNGHLTVYQQVLFRVCAGFIIGLIIFRKQIDLQKFKHLPARDTGVLFLRGASFFLIAVPLFTLAINHAKYTNIAFIDAIPMTAFLGVIFLSERITKKHVLFLCLAAAGALLISLRDPTSLSSWGQGELYELLSLFFFAINYIGRKWHTPLLNNFELAMGSFACSIPLLMIATLIFDGLKPITWTAGIVLVVCIAGLFNTAIAYLVNYGFDRVPAVLGSNLMNTQPIFALVVSFLVYREVPVLREIIGGLVIVVSAIGMTRLKKT